MALHAISVFDMVYKWSPEKILHLKSTIKCLKEVKIDKLLDLPYSFLPIDCCVRIKWWAWPFIQWWYSVIDILIVTAEISTTKIVFLAVYWSIWISSYNTDIKVLFFYGASTMLNNVFKSSPEPPSSPHPSTWFTACASGKVLPSIRRGIHSRVQAPSRLIPGITSWRWLRRRGWKGRRYRVLWCPVRSLSYSVIKIKHPLNNDTALSSWVFLLYSYI